MTVALPFTAAVADPMCSDFFTPDRKQNWPLVPYHQRTYTRSTTETDPYNILGVRPEASIEEVRLAYKSLAGRVHPDHARNPREKAQFEIESQRLGEAFSKIKTQLKSRFSYFGEEQDLIKIMNFVRAMGLEKASEQEQDLIQEASFQIEKAARLGFDPALYEQARNLRASLRQLFEYQTRNATPAEFAAICDQVRAEIEGPRSLVILEAFFASTRSLERPDLLLHLTEMGPKWSNNEEGAKTALFTAFRHKHWASSEAGRRLITKLIGEMKPYYQGVTSGSGSFLDLAGRHLFFTPEWHKALAEDADLREAHYANVLRYLHAVRPDLRPYSQFAQAWFSSPEVIKYPERIIEIFRFSPKLVVQSFISFPHLRDSTLFWTYFEKVKGYAEQNFFFDALLDAEYDLARTKRGEELLEKYFEKVARKGERRKNRESVVNLAKILSSPHWVHTPQASRMMEDLLLGEGEIYRNNGLIELLALQRSDWPQQSVALVSAWARMLFLTHKFSFS